MKLANSNMAELYTMARGFRNFKEGGQLDLIAQQKVFDLENQKLVDHNSYLEESLLAIKNSMNLWITELAACRSELKQAKAEIVALRKDH